MSIEINRDTISKLQNADPEALRIAITTIMQAMGAKNRQIDMALSNTEQLKKKISRISEAELIEIASKIPPEKAEELKRLLNIK